MAFQIVVPAIRRPIDPDMFADITDQPFTYVQNFVQEYELTFQGDDLTPEQAQAVLDRCVMSPEKEQIKNAAVSAVSTLTGYKNFQGTASLQQLTDAVRTMAAIEIGIIETLFNELK